MINYSIILSEEELSSEVSHCCKNKSSAIQEWWEYQNIYYISTQYTLWVWTVWYHFK